MQLSGEFAHHWSVCHNISLGGARLFTDAAVPTGAVLDINVALGEHGNVEAVGKVTRSRGGELGVVFLLLSPASRFAIASYASGRPPPEPAFAH